MKNHIALVVAAAGLFLLMRNAALASSMPPAVPAASTSAQMNTGGEKISGDLRAAMKAASPGDMLTVIVTLNDQLSTLELTSTMPPGVNRQTRQKTVIEQLQSQADVSQRDLKQLLDRYQAEGRVSDLEYFWIFNGLAFNATPDVILELAVHPDVQMIEVNKTIQAPPPPTPSDLNVMAIPGANLQNINATELWNLGYTGQGIVVANLDTGVDMASHPDLAAKWRGGSNSWFDPYGQNATPKDFAGHGTATMGIMVGGENNGQAYGMAPGAQWIAAKIFNNSGMASTLAIHQALQWVLDPDGNPNTPDAPHVVNNSWTWTPGCNYEFRTAVKNLRAAGILPVFAAGNNPSVSYSPANYPEAFAVGAVDDFDVIWPDSSRGPSACDTTSYPEMVAPGVNIPTTDAYGGYAYYTGTSMAAPHVVGALALLLNASPHLTADEQEAALLDGVVDLGDAGIDNSYGNGRLEVFESLYSLGSVNLTVTQTGNVDVMLANQPVNYTITVTNEGPAGASNLALTNTISANTTAASAVISNQIGTASANFVIGAVSTSQGSCTLAGSNIICTTGWLDAGNGITITYTLTPTVSGINVSHNVRVSALETDYNGANNLVQSSTAVGDLDLSLTHNSVSGSMIANKIFTYTVQVANSGPVEASNVILTHTLAPGVMLDSVLPDQGSCGLPGSFNISCSLGKVSGKSSVSITFRLMPVAGGITITDTTTVSTAELDVVSQNNRVSLNVPVLEKSSFSIFLPVVIK